jgi:predicted metal-dependent hydrolase
MSKKSPRIRELMAGCEHPVWDSHYAAYFSCFNRQFYYEAHDVLEELWLAEGKEGPNYAFYKGLIQGAGAFVHLKLHHAHPHHRVHGQRLAPASRLFRLALKNTAPYRPRHQDLDLDQFHLLCQNYLHSLEAGHFQTNPWSPESAPHLPWPS